MGVLLMFLLFLLVSGQSAQVLSNKIKAENVSNASLQTDIVSSATNGVESVSSELSYTTKVRISTINNSRVESVSSNALYFNLTKQGQYTLQERALYSLPNIVLSKNLTLCLKFYLSDKEEQRMTLFSFSTQNKESSITLNNRYIRYVRDLEIMEITRLPPSTLISACFRIYNSNVNDSAQLILNITELTNKGNTLFNADLKIPFNWFWLLETQHQPINLEVIHYSNLKMFLLKDISHWNRQLSDNEIKQYLIEQKVESKLFSGLLAKLEESELVLELVKMLEIQFIESKKMTGCSTIVIPYFFRCRYTCEHIRSELICDSKRDCIDGTDEEICNSSSSFIALHHYISWNNGRGKPIQKSVISGDVLHGLVEFTICFTVSGLSRGPILTYGPTERDLLIHFDADESVAIVLFGEYPVYFAVKHDIMAVNRVCLRMDSTMEISLFTNGALFIDQRTFPEIPHSKTFGHGTLTIGLDEKSGIGLPQSKMMNLNIWDKSLSDNEMYVYSSIDTCTVQEGTIIGWNDVLTNLRVTSPHSERQHIMNRTMIEQLLLKPSTICSQSFIKKTAHNWDEFDSLKPPEIKGTTVILLEDVYQLVTSGSAEESGLYRKHSDHYLLPTRTKICFNFNFKEKRVRRNFTVVLAIGNPYGLSDVNININGRKLSYLCLHCSTYIQIITDIPLTDNSLCIYDARTDMSQPLLGYPSSNLTGTFIKKILIKEQPKSWLCSEDVTEEKLYGKFMWGSTNTISTAICPLGYVGLVFKAGYASRICDVHTDNGGNKTGVWSTKTNLDSCQHRFEYNSLKELLDDVDHKRNLLNGNDLMHGLRNALRNRQTFNEEMVKRIIEIILSVLEVERAKIPPRNNCWYSHILRDIFGSPYNKLFIPFKWELLPPLTSGGLDLKCTQHFIHHNSFIVNKTNPLLMIKCVFGDYIEGDSECMDISNTTQSTMIQSTYSVMIIQTLTRHLVELGISKIYITTIRTPILHKTYFARSLQLDNKRINVTLVSPNVAVETDVSPNVAVETDGPEYQHRKLQFYYYYQNSQEGEDLSNAYCAYENMNKTDSPSFHWSNSATKLINRGQHFVNCSASEIDTLGVIINDKVDRWGKRHATIISTFELVADITTIIFLIVTAIVCGCWVHDCQNAAQLYIAFSVFYSATYALKLISFSAASDRSFCGNCGGLLLFFLLSSVIMLFCAGVALHVRIEDRYEVQYFVGKCISFALGTAFMIIICVVIYDNITKATFTTIFVTSDIYTDLSPIECWIAPPVRYVVVLFPILLCLVTLIICLYRLKVVIEKGEDAQNDLALIKCTIIIALLISITWTIGNLSIGREDLTLQYLFLSFNAIQGVLIFYLVCIYSTTICPTICLQLRTRKNALLQQNVNELISSNSSEYSASESSASESSASDSSASDSSRTSTVQHVQRRTMQRV